MKRCTKCGVCKPLEAFSKNARAKDGLQHHCKPCKLEYQRNNPNRAVSVQKYYEANREACIARSVASQAKKSEYYAQKMREWVARNKERHLATRRAWYSANSARDIDRVRRRQARIKGANNLTQAEQAEVDGVYRFCQLFRGFEVDHIIPLNGKAVSGLHVPNNLQVLLKSENRKKGNKLIE